MNNEFFKDALREMLNYCGLGDFRSSLSSIWHQNDYNLTISNSYEVDRYETSLDVHMSNISKLLVDNIENSQLVKEKLAKKDQEIALLKNQVSQLLNALSDGYEYLGDEDES